MKILLIEDEKPLALALIRVLTDAGGKVTWADNGQKGFDTAMHEDFDVVVLDVLLPKKNGWEVCAELRAAKRTVPILMLTALDDLQDKLKGFHVGADDYLPKPFETPELVARVRALLRRDKVHKSLVTRIADLELDRENRRVTRAGQEIKLTRREYDLLEALASNEGRVLSRQTIQERVWTDDESFSNTVDVFVGTLRKKIDSPFPLKLIHTVHGFGYVLRNSDAAY
jgi:two-component system copper resistance phosphate regulon response regulator CusR